MRIGLQTWGSEGDIRPFLALAGGLRQAGHDVHLVLTSVQGRSYAAVARRLDISLTETPSPSPQQRDVLARQVLAASLPRQLQLIHQHLLDPVAPAMFAAATALARDVDVIVSHPLAFPATLAAWSARRPLVLLSPVPSAPLAIPPPGAPDLGRHLNRLAWRLGIWLITRRQLLPAIRNLAGSAGIPAPGAALLDRWPRLVLTAISPTLIQRPATWPAAHQLCGFLHLPGDHAPLTSATLEFLAAGTPPVFAGLGSLIDFDPDPTATLGLLIDAVRAAGRRIIVQGPWERLPRPTGDDVLAIGPVDHQLLFPHCATVIHHGGAGTTHATARAGVPAVVIPHGMDQPFWARIVAGLGVAPPALPRLRLDRPRLTAAIHQAAGLGPSAAALATRMAGEDGVATAIRLITAVVQGSSKTSG